MINNKIELITVINSNEYNAGPKAQKDIIRILQEKLGKNFIEKTLLFSDDARTNLIKRIGKNIKKIIEFMKINFEKNIKIIQYPISLSFGLMNILNGKNVIAFVHDLLGLRYQNNKAIKKEIKLLNKYHSIIVHNKKMKEYLVSKGIKAEKIFILELFIIF